MFAWERQGKVPGHKLGSLNKELKMTPEGSWDGMIWPVPQLAQRWYPFSLLPGALLRVVLSGLIYQCGTVGITSG